MATVSFFLAFYISVAKGMLSLAVARLYTPQKPPFRDLSGQVAIVTGANSGIGLAIATGLAKQGATVYLACRSLERGNAAVDSIVSQIGAGEKRRILLRQLDIGDLDSVRRFCEQWVKEGGKVDMLLHNAGIAEPPPGAKKTDEKGREIVVMTNFLGSFLMTHLLEPHLTPTSRVVFTSSTGHYGAGKCVLQSRPPAPLTPSYNSILGSVKTYLGMGTSSAPSYCHSKAHQVLFASLLQQHFSSSSASRRTSHAFTPGFTSTPIFNNVSPSWTTFFSNPIFAVLKATEKWAALDTHEGAQTGVWLASWGGVEGRNGVEGGGYWDFGVRRISLIDFVRVKIGEEVFREKCRGVWKGWEEDVGVKWDVEI
jgi:NAD(P)-dependent dehydrogenase (short-subunit alcohol dehydrogenase family)